MVNAVRAQPRHVDVCRRGDAADGARGHRHACSDRTAARSVAVVAIVRRIKRKTTKEISRLLVSHVRDLGVAPSADVPTFCAERRGLALIDPPCPGPRTGGDVWKVLAAGEPLTRAIEAAGSRAPPRVGSPVTSRLAVASVSSVRNGARRPRQTHADQNVLVTRDSDQRRRPHHRDRSPSHFCREIVGAYQIRQMHLAWGGNATSVRKSVNGCSTWHRSSVADRGRRDG